jgi:beta-lactam-binding protein with PASTA domain
MGDPMRRSLLFLVIGLAAVTVAGCGGESVTVPPVAGDSDPGVLEAYDLLRSAGFRVEITRDFGISTPEYYRVVQEWPSGGSQARPGSVVELTIAAGPQGSGWVPPPSSWDREKPLPSLVGMRVSEAVAWLRRNELGRILDLPALPATNRRNLLDAYVVTKQEPGAGHQAPPSYSVYLKGRLTDGALQEWRGPTVRVPHVAGDNLFDAYPRLHERGLRVSTDRRLSRGDAQEIIVRGLRPAPGASVRRGTNVLLQLRPRAFVHRCVWGPSRRLRMRNLVGGSLGAAVRWARANHVSWELRDAPPLPHTSGVDLLNAYIVTAQTPRGRTMLPRIVHDGFGTHGCPIQLTARLGAR